MAVSPLSSQETRRKARKKYAEHISADDAPPSARRAILVPTRPRGVSRRRSDAGLSPGHGLVLRGEVDGRRRGRGGEVRVETRREKDGTAARADGGHVRCRDGHVVLRVEWARDRARQVRQRDVRSGDVEVLGACRVGDEKVDIRERPAAWSASVDLERGDGTYLFVSPRPSEPRPQFVSTVEREE